MKAIGNFFFALGKLIGLIEKIQRKQEQEKAQDEYEKIERDPADWWQSNFDGVSDDAKLPDDAKGTSKTDSDDK